MSPSSTHGPRLTRTRRVSIAGVVAAGAAAVAVSLVPDEAAAAPAAKAVAPSPVATGTAAPVAFTTEAQGAQVSTVRDGLGGKQSALLPAPAPAQQPAAAKEEDDDASADAAPESESEKEPASAPEYPDNLDGWIREAMAIMDKHDIPGSYEGIHRNIMRESSGDPNAINLWDINARNGVPSKGLLQVIQPTFDAYHVEGTEYDLYDPVANIVAACNYAADRYGSMDNVNGPY